MKDGLTQVKELKDKIHEQYIEIQELNKENDRLKNIIEEAKEYIESRARKACVELMPREIELLEILNKGE